MFLLVSIPEAKLADSFWFVRAKRNPEYPTARLVCSFFYAIGFAFTLWVLGQGGYYVIQQTLR